jgi:phage major head subunit gpT-like protein
LPRGDKARQRKRELAEQRLARRHRQVVARRQVFTDRRQMAETFDHAVDRERRNVGVGIFQKCEASLRRSDFGDGRRQRARQHRAAGNRDLRRRLAGGDQIDQVFVKQ